MQFIVALTALASLAAAGVPHTRQELVQNFEFQNFAASCVADNDQCTFSFNLNGGDKCTASQPAFTGSDFSGRAFKKLPNIGQTTCGTITWNGVRGTDGVYTVSATDKAAGLTGTRGIVAADFTIANGLESYTGNGIVNLYGTQV